MRLRRAGVIYSDLIATFFASRPLINCACSKLKRIIYQSVNKTLMPVICSAHITEHQMHYADWVLGLPLVPWCIMYY